MIIVKGLRDPEATWAVLLSASGTLWQPVLPRDGTQGLRLLVTSAAAVDAAIIRWHSIIFQKVTGITE